MRLRPAAGIAVSIIVAMGAKAAPAAAGDGERFAPCTACHGTAGVSRSPGTPSLAGQPSFYAITQLFLFREGRRTDAAMTAVAKGMSDADLRAFSEIVGRLPPAPAAEPTPVDPARSARGAALADRHRCTSCHGSDLAGGKQVPRLAGQREDYLARALAEFRAGTRIGYTPAMSEVLAGIDPADLPDLAHYLSHAHPPTVLPAAPASR